MCTGAWDATSPSSSTSATAPGPPPCCRYPGCFLSFPQGMLSAHTLAPRPHTQLPWAPHPWQSPVLPLATWAQREGHQDWSHTDLGVHPNSATSERAVWSLTAESLSMPATTPEVLNQTHILGWPDWVGL